MYLLDTHAIIWYVIGSTELSATVRNLMETKRCFFSFVSLWEIAIKQTRNLLQYKNSIQDIIDACKEEEFAELLVSGESLELIKNLPDIHRDPFDRLIITMAQENNLTIVTKDTKIPLYDVKTVW